MFLLVLALSLLLAAPALAVEISDGDALQKALNDPAVDSVTIIAPLAFPEGEITVDKLLIFRAPEGVNDFVIGKDTVVTLTEKGTIATVSSFEEAFFLNRVLVYGALDARAGSVLPDSTLYVRSGEWTLPRDAENVIVSGGAVTEEGLLALLADERIGEIMVHADIALTQDAAVNRILRVQDGATLTLQGCTLTIGEKGELAVGEGSGVYNQGALLNQGRITLETGSKYQGDAPAGSGEMIRE